MTDEIVVKKRNLKQSKRDFNRFTEKRQTVFQSWIKSNLRIQRKWQTNGFNTGWYKWRSCLMETQSPTFERCKELNYIENGFNPLKNRSSVDRGG